MTWDGGGRPKGTKAYDATHEPSHVTHSLTARPPTDHERVLRRMQEDISPPTFTSTLLYYSSSFFHLTLSPSIFLHHSSSLDPDITVILRAFPHSPFNPQSYVGPYASSSVAFGVLVMAASSLFLHLCILCSPLKWPVCP